MTILKKVFNSLYKGVNLDTSLMDETVNASNVSIDKSLVYDIKERVRENPLMSEK